MNILIYIHENPLFAKSTKDFFVKKLNFFNAIESFSK